MVSYVIIYFVIISLQLQLTIERDPKDSPQAAHLPLTLSIPQNVTYRILSGAG